MKIFLIATGAFFLSHVLSAQEVSFGIKAGINKDAVKLEVSPGNKTDTYEGSKIGFQAGLVSNVAFSQHFMIQPNLLIVSKGGAFNFSDTEHGHVNMLNIELPISFLYKDNGFFVGAGPNFSYGLSAKYDPSTSNKIYDMYDEQTFDFIIKRFSVGGNTLMGFQFANGATISANYTFTLTTLSERKDVYKIGANYLGLSIGYMLGKR